MRRDAIMTDNCDGLATRNVAVYIVFGVARSVVNDRTKKLLQLRNRFNKMVLVTPGKQNTEHSDGLEIKPIPNPTGILQRLGLQKLRRTLDRYLFVPSPHILFVLTARRILSRLITDDLAQGKSVCLMTCAPPHGMGLIGLYIKRKLPQVHWVIDWQDLWSYDENYFDVTPKLYRNRLKSMEQRMLQASDMNVTTNPYARAVLENHYGVPHDRTSFIPHHFDFGDIAESTGSPRPLTVRKENAAIRIGFLGTLFKPPRVPGADFVEALAQLRTSGHNVELHVHGLYPRGYEKMEKHLRQAGVIMHGPSSHEEAVRQLAAYDFLLVLLADLANCKVVMSIKLPHYLIMGKPIIGVVPKQSAIADIITDTGAGVVIPTDSDWSKELGKILSSDLSCGTPERNDDAINRFNWEKVSVQWRNLLARVCLGSKDSADPSVILRSSDASDGLLKSSEARQ